jgi:hypothetical protein
MPIDFNCGLAQPRGNHRGGRRHQDIDLIQRLGYLSATTFAGALGFEIIGGLQQMTQLHQGPHLRIKIRGAGPEVPLMDDGGITADDRPQYGRGLFEVVNGDILHLGSEPSQMRDRPVHGAAHRGLQALEEVAARHPDAHPSDLSGQSGQVIWHRCFRRGWILGIIAGDGVQHERGIVDVLG